MNYGHVYVASVAFGAEDAQTVRPSSKRTTILDRRCIIAYSHCIAHGYDMAFGLDQQKRAVDSGIWPRLPVRSTPRSIRAKRLW